MENIIKIKQKLAEGCPLEAIKDLMGQKSVEMSELYAS